MERFFGIPKLIRYPQSLLKQMDSANEFLFTNYDIDLEFNTEGHWYLSDDEEHVITFSDLNDFQRNCY